MHENVFLKIILESDILKQYSQCLEWNKKFDQYRDKGLYNEPIRMQDKVWTLQSYYWKTMENTCMLILEAINVYHRKIHLNTQDSAL